MTTSSEDRGVQTVLRPLIPCSTRAITLKPSDFGRRTMFSIVRILSPAAMVCLISSKACHPRYGMRTTLRRLSGDFVIVHGRFSGFGPVNWVVADILRIENVIFVEHWDVIQDEARREQSQSGLPMFGDKFPT